MKWFTAGQLKYGDQHIEWQDHNHFFVELFWSGSYKRYQVMWQSGNRLFTKVGAARRFYQQRKRTNCRLLAERVLLGTTT